MHTILATSSLSLLAALAACQPKSVTNNTKAVTYDAQSESPSASHVSTTETSRDSVAPTTSAAASKNKGPARVCSNMQDGSRSPYHTMGNGRWIQDCNTPHGREYYRVFTPERTTDSFLIPRPDGTPILGQLCAAPSDELKTRLARYDWCKHVDGATRVDKINAMSMEDAVFIAHELHLIMKFRPVPGSIMPYPMPNDVAEACEGASSEALQSACIRHAPKATDEAITLSSAEAIALAGALNKLYQIP